MLKCYKRATYCIVLVNHRLSVPSEVDERELSPGSSQEVAEAAEGFGKLYPSTQASQQEEEHSDDEQDLPKDVISRKELEKGRLSRDGKHDLTAQWSALIARRVLGPNNGGQSVIFVWV